MGWCCSQAAADTMDRIRAACKRSQQQAGLDISEGGSNAFFLPNGSSYFFEITRRDQPDMGIRGTVCKDTAPGWCRRAGSFHIDGKGRVVRGPAFFKRAAATE